MIHALYAISVYDQYSQYMILSSVVACYIYFLSLDNEGTEAVSTIPIAPPLISCRITYNYEQLLGSQESTRRKRKFSLSHKQRMLALRHQAHSRGYVGRQSFLLVYMVFAVTQNID